MSKHVKPGGHIFTRLRIDAIIGPTFGFEFAVGTWNFSVGHLSCG